MTHDCACCRSKKHSGLKKKRIHASLVELTAAALAGPGDCAPAVAAAPETHAVAPKQAALA